MIPRFPISVRYEFLSVRSNTFPFPDSHTRKREKSQPEMFPFFELLNIFIRSVFRRTARRSRRAAMVKDLLSRMLSSKNFLPNNLKTASSQKKKTRRQRENSSVRLEEKKFKARLSKTQTGISLQDGPFEIRNYKEKEIYFRRFRTSLMSQREFSRRISKYL